MEEWKVAVFAWSPTAVRQCKPSLSYLQEPPLRLPWWVQCKESTCNAGDLGIMGSILGLGRFLGEGNGNPLQSSCLEDPMDRGAWWAMVHRVTKSSKRLSNWAHTYLVALNHDQGGRNQGGRDKGVGITGLSENCSHDVWVLTGWVSRDVLDQGFSNVSMWQNYLEGFLKLGCSGPFPQCFWFWN